MGVLPRLLTVLGGFFFAVAFVTRQQKLRKLGSEQKKEQRVLAFVILLETVAGKGE
jgi:hypothetical protein